MREASAALDDSTNGLPARESSIKEGVNCKERNTETQISIDTNKRQTGAPRSESKLAKRKSKEQTTQGKQLKPGQP